MSAVRGSRVSTAAGAGPDHAPVGAATAGGAAVGGGTANEATENGAAVDGTDAAASDRKVMQRAACCPFYHEAVELVGRRWTGAIIRVLMDRPMCFSEISHSVPELSDRLLSERMKELEARGIVDRTVHPGPPVRVEYSLSTMGRELSPALLELQRWARRWLRSREIV